MTTPTASQLKAEVEGGPLASALAGPWADVFPAESEPAADSPARPRWERIRGRFGTLTPDGIDALLKVLSDPSRRSKPYPMAVATFARFLAGRGLLRKVKAAAADAQQPDAVRDVADLVVTLTQSAPDRVIDPADAQAMGMIGVLVDAGVASSADVTAFLAACSKPCSRLDELGWAGVTADLLRAAKAL